MANEASEMAGQPLPAHGTFCWTEIGSTNADACQEFYTEVFGWNFKSGAANAGDFDYREFNIGNPYPEGGLYQIDPAFFGDNPPPSHYMTYVAVDDVDSNAELARSLGATIVRGPMDVPNVGRIAV